MKILVIPDIHLKPNMFRRASELMRQKIADQAVCLMDIADDWDQGLNISLYEETYDEAIRFAETYPQTLWCYGNHDLSYIWNQLETGYSNTAAGTVQKKLFQLQSALLDPSQIGYVQRIDSVMFSHGGVLQSFVEWYVPTSKSNDIDMVIETINNLGVREMWNDASPIWLRPQYYNMKMYKPRKLLQVVGHTPVTEIMRNGNVISCDVFSTYRNGKMIGTGEFLLLDTNTWEYQGIS